MTTINIPDQLPDESPLDFVNRLATDGPKKLKERLGEGAAPPLPSPPSPKVAGPMPKPSEPAPPPPLPEPEPEPIPEPEPAPPSLEALENDLVPDAPLPTEEPTPPVTDSVEDLLSTDPKKKTAGHFRKTIKEKEEIIKQHTAKIDELLSKVQKYESGEVVPEVFQTLTNRVAELEQYEAIINIKATPEYEQNIGAPLENKRNKLYKHAADYGIPVNIIEQAFDLEDKALNAFLSDNFDDILGANEAKQLIADISGLQVKAAEYEQNPKHSLETLRVQGQEIARQKDQIRRNTIAGQAKTSWTKTLTSIQQTGKAEELIYRNDDPDHNEHVVKPILGAAAKEFGMLVRRLADLGLTELPEDVCNMLSNTVLTAHASAVSIESRKRALDLATEMEAHARRSTTVNRPRIGSAPPVNGSAPRQPPQNDRRDPQEKIRSAVDDLITNAMSKG